MSKAPEKATPLIVCAAITVHNGKILITQRPHDKQLGGFWEFPGGKLEEGETPEAALVRELREELDISIEVDRIFEVVHHTYDWGSVLILAYICRWTRGTIVYLDVADHRWLTPEEMTNCAILPADQPIIARLLAENPAV